MSVQEVHIYKTWKRPPQAKPIRYIITPRGCWECISHSINWDGYTQMRVKGRTARLHRVVFELEREKIKPGNVVIHKCDNPRCFNPDHLSQGTQRDNVLDMVRKGRGYDRRGTRNPRSILTERDVYEIKHFLKFTKFLQREIAALYGVDKSAISLIKLGKRYPEITI